MAPGKDQHNFRTPENSRPAASEHVFEPINKGPGADPQKSPALGPEYDFTAPAVLAAEDGLRAAVGRLKAELELLPEDLEGETGYARLQACLSGTMPEVYRTYDLFVSAVLASGPEKPTCSKGCSHCCSHYVTSVEPYELIHLHGRVRSSPEYPSKVIGLHRRAALFGTLRDGKEDEQSEDRALYRYYLRGTTCPFLEAGGKCGVYDSRPISCRMFFSLSHPSLCKGKGVVDPGNRNFLLELPEDIEADLSRAAAPFARLRLPESLFEGLLKVNETFGRFDPHAG